MSAGSVPSPPPPPPEEMQRQAHEGSPLVVITAAQEPAGTERQWQAPDVEGPGGLECRMSPPITTYPQSGQKDGGGCHLDGKAWNECLILKELMGNLGAVNDSCCAIESTDSGCASLCRIAIKEKEEDKMRFVMKSLVSYLNLFLNQHCTYCIQEQLT